MNNYNMVVFRKGRRQLLQMKSITYAGAPHRRKCSLDDVFQQFISFIHGRVKIHVVSFGTE